MSEEIDKNNQPETPKSDTKNVHSDEIKETLNTVPELETEYFKVPSLSLEHKKSIQIGETIDGWKAEEAGARLGEKKEKTQIVVLKKEIPGQEPGAYVTEYLSGVPEELIGSQLFNGYAVVNLGLEKKLPTEEILHAIAGGEDKRQELVDKTKLLQIGSLDGHRNEFIKTGKYPIYLRLKDRKYALVREYDDTIYAMTSTLVMQHSYPIRLLAK